MREEWQKRETERVGDKQTERRRVRERGRKGRERERKKDIMYMKSCINRNILENTSFYLRLKSFIFGYLGDTVPRILILVSFQSLHSSLHHINRSVSKHTSCPSYPSNKEGTNISNVFCVVATLQVALQIGVDEESNGLICTLLDDGGSYPLIGTSET